MTQILFRLKTSHISGAPFRVGIVPIFIIMLLDACPSVASTSLMHIDQQRQTVSGVITDESGEGLPGASVVEKGTVNGTVTDIDGAYTLEVSDQSTLIISFVGYVTENIEVSDRSVIDIQMTPDLEALDEVVVVGYGSQRKQDLTGSISSIGPDDFGDIPMTETTQAIKGMAAGVAVTQNSGAPGGDFKIRIRGANSILGGNDPLIVLDGVPSNINLADINPNDVESIQILKDASSTAIFGSRGANGVILVQTKRGRESQGIKLEYNPFVTIKQSNSKYDKLNAGEYARVVNASEGSEFFSIEDIARFDRDGGTDWQDEVVRTGVLQNHQLVCKWRCWWC